MAFLVIGRGGLMIKPQLYELCFILKFNSLESSAKTQRRQENRVVSILLEILCVFASLREKLLKRKFKISINYFKKINQLIQVRKLRLNRIVYKIEDDAFLIVQIHYHYQIRLHHSTPSGLQVVSIGVIAL